MQYKGILIFWKQKDCGVAMGRFCTGESLQNITYLNKDDVNEHKTHQQMQ